MHETTVMTDYGQQCPSLKYAMMQVLSLLMRLFHSPYAQFHSSSDARFGIAKCAAIRVARLALPGQR